MADALEGRPRLAAHAVGWGVVGVLLAALVHLLAGVGWLAAAAFAVPLALTAIPSSFSGFYLSRALPLTRASLTRVSTTVAAAALVTGVMWTGLGMLWWRVLQYAAPTALTPIGPPPRTIWGLLLVVGAAGYMLAMTANYIIRSVERSAEVERRALQSEIAAREAELRALRAQIDPHFLFNSLNSISGLVGVDPTRARAMCQRLGDFLRDSLTLGGLGQITLARETALVRQYLEIEQVRFGARLDIRTAVQAEAGDALVPALLLQPLVENAVRHGIATCIDGGAVTVTADRTSDRIVVVVENPRDPDAARRRGTGLGLDIVRRRLHGAFGDDASLAASASEFGYRVVVTLPVIAARAPSPRETVKESV